MRTGNPGARTVLSAATHAGQTATENTSAFGAEGLLAPWCCRALLRVKTRAPSLRPIPERGQSCPQQRTQGRRQPKTPARSGADALLLAPWSCRALLRVKTRAPSLCQSRSADSLVRSNARRANGNRKHQRVRADALLLARRGLVGRCCGLKPARRHCGQSRSADSLVRSNARRAKRNLKYQRVRSERCFWRLGLVGRCCGLKPG